MRIPPRLTNTPGTPELKGLDRYDLDALQGDGVDESNPNNWPTRLKKLARENWPDGPEDFDRWLATYPSVAVERRRSEEKD